MDREPRALPFVLRTRQQIDKVFTRYVGPIAIELCREEFDGWVAEKQLRPSALHQYISRLADHIAERRLRESFIDEASECIDVLSGFKV